MKKIGFIGLGHIGKGMANSLIKNNVSTDILGYHYSASKSDLIAKELKIHVTNNYEHFLAGVEYIFLAVRPNQLDDVIAELTKFDISNKVIISAISGLSNTEIRKKFNNENLKAFRIMPNMNAEIGMSATGYNFTENIDSLDRENIKVLLSTFGSIFEIQDDVFSVFTAIAGCSPAYFFEFLDSFAKFGDANGIPYEKSLEIAIKSGLGSLTTASNSALKMSDLVNSVAVPNGVTIEGLSVLNKEKFDEKIAKSLEAIVKKDQKLHK